MRPRFQIEALEDRRLLAVDVAAVDRGGGEDPPPTFRAPVAAANLALPARQVENLNRGVVAIKKSGTQVYVSWRMLGTDPGNVAFNLYRSANGAAAVKLNANPLTTTTDFTDTTFTASAANRYFVRPVISGVEQADSDSFTLPASAATQWYLSVPLQVPPAIPAGGTFNGITYTDGITWSANDCSVGDVDGDGEYEIIVKWDPSNSKDNSQSGYTGNVYLDAYKMNGTRLWRVDLGINIRAGAHYTQFMVYDLDGDGRAEVACKTAPGTKDALGNNVILGADNPSADYRNSSGYILSGPEYLTLFNGQTGAAMATTSYNPPRGSVSSWGDNYGNRVDRFLATVAYLDGQRPSLVMCRGYYTRATLWAVDWRDGQLTQRWLFDSNNGGVDAGAYGQGTHNISVGDVDGDGKDEIVYGACTIDDNGHLLSTSGLGHGDALHLSDMDPSRPGLEVFQIHESQSAHQGNGGSLRNASTNQLILGVPGSGDVGRGVAFDIEPAPGYEMWTSADANIYNVDGTVVASRGNAFYNFGVWWDADFYRELLDGTTIADWNISTHGRSNFDLDPGSSNSFPPGVSSNNSTKQTPALSGDILGDWREEVIWRRSDSSALNIYTTTIPATSRMFTLMHDVQYREAIAWQNVAYNQPPHPSFFLGNGMNPAPAPNVYLAGVSSPPVGGTTTTIYPAEAATLGGGSFVETTNGGFNGTGYINSPTTGGSIQFNSVDGGSSGGAGMTIRFRYALGAAGSRTGSLVVNGVAQPITFTTTGAWNTWTTQTITVPLNAGATNTIRLETNGQDLANIDELQVDAPGAVTTTSSVSGKLFLDANDNGVADGSEAGVNGVVVFLDADNDATLDAAELRTTTLVGGVYGFTDVPAGAYVVRAVVYSGYVPTTTPTVVVTAGGSSVVANPAVERISYGGFAADETYRVRRSASSGKYEVLINDVLKYTVFAAAPSLAFNLLSGNDALVVDHVGGTPVPAGGLTYNGGGAAVLATTTLRDTLEVVGQSAASTFDINATQVVGGGRTMTYAGVENINLSTGTHTVTANLGNVDLTVAANTIANINATQPQLARLTVLGSAKLTEGGAKVLVTGDLVVGTAGRLDLTNNAMIVRNSGLASVQAMIAAGYAGGAWNGNGGITSLTAAANPSGTTALGFASNAVLKKTSFAGVTGLASTDVLVKYTYYGDADLSGHVTLDDFSMFLLGYQQTGTTWLTGDFNFNGAVTLDDFAAFLAGYQRQGPVL